MHLIFVNTAYGILYLKHTVVHLSDLVSEEVLHLLPLHLEGDVGDEHAALDGGFRAAASTAATSTASSTIAAR